MRLDQFLKISRIIKRRTVAQEFSSGGGVFINGRQAKAASEVKEGDELILYFGHRTLTVRIERVPLKKAVPVQEASSLYQVISDVRKPGVSSAESDDLLED